MDRASLAAALLKAMIAWVPISAHATRETEEDVRARYASIAEDIARETLNAPDSAIPYRAWGKVDGRVTQLPPTDKDRVASAFLMLSIARYESNFIREVDTCEKSGDHDDAWGLWQVHAKKEKVCESRVAALRIALSYAAKSFRDCAEHDRADRLSIYTSGRCYAGQKQSRQRVILGEVWLSVHPVKDLATGMVLY